MNKHDMLQALKESTVADMPYILVPSYKRPDFKFASRILSQFTSKGLEKVFIFVREEQYKAYKKQNPHLQYEIIPKGAVSGVGSTRNFLLEYAIKNRLPIVMDMDDDVDVLQFLFNTTNAAGEVVSRHSTMDMWIKYPHLPQRILQLAGVISKEVFKNHPEVAVGNIRKQRFSGDRDCGETKYMINKGPTARQTKILNVKLCKKYNLRVPEEFNLHGDDIGFVAEVLQRGFSCFNIPCLCYDYIDEKLNSVVRDPTNEDANRWLHKLEYDALQQMDIGKRGYLRETFKFDDGQYKFGDVNWQKYHKTYSTSPIVERW